MDDIDLLVQVAIYYYNDNMTQEEIAEKIFVSRPTVSNLLRRAKELGIVTFNIQHPNFDRIQKENLIRDKYHLKNVQIASASNDLAVTKKLVGIKCAEYVEKNLHKYHKIGLGWGTTLHEFVTALNNKSHPDLEIIPLIGGFGISDVRYHSNHLAFKISEKLNCDVKYFYAPAIAETEEVKYLFESTELFHAIVDEVNQLDLAILGIGNPIESSTYKDLGIISVEEVKELIQLGAVGDILTTFFDQDMQQIDSSVSKRMIGVDYTALESVDEVLILASGKEKLAALRALLKSNLNLSLVIDSDLAEELLTDN